MMSDYIILYLSVACWRPLGCSSVEQQAVVDFEFIILAYCLGKFL